MTRRWLATALVAILHCLPASAWAGSPTDQVREYTDQVLRVLEDPELKQEGRRKERLAAVRKIANEVFDVTETAKRALGRHWQARTPAERAEFAALFADLLEQTYMSKIDHYGGERVRYLGESVDGDFAIVRARIARKGTEVPVESRLLRRGARWLIYDVAIEGISLINNYRSQFDQIIRTSSYEELVRRIKTRRDELSTDKAAKPRPPS